MSSALAIASVTAVLRNLLENGMIDDQVAASVGHVNVTALAPDLVVLDRAAGSQLNLFMYLALPNSGWRNEGLPSRDAGGQRRSNAPLALDLHYLLTAYASRDLHAEILLGYGMQVLHETPVLPREGIRRALGVPGLVEDPADVLPPALEMLGASGLAEQVELVKVTPESMTPDDVSKLWSALQRPYRPSAAYRASVVLIEADRPVRAPLPVRERRIYVAPFRLPVIDRVLARETATGEPHAGPLLARHHVLIRGRRLASGDVVVRLAGTDVVPPPDAVEDTAITFAVPPGTPAGVATVQVRQRQAMGEPPLPHTGVSSNLAAVVLHPEITAPVGMPAPGVVRVTVSPPVATGQRVTLLLNEQLVVGSPAAPRAPRAYSFLAPPRGAGSPPLPSDTIEVPIDDVAAGTYLVRVVVDGAESPLETNAAGAYSGPVVVVP